MSKIYLKASLKNQKEKYSFEGKAIKNKKTIIYNDNNVITKITIDDIITIERKKDYILIINLKEGINLEGKYITKYGSFKLNALASKIEKNKKHLKIIYELTINDEYIDTFEYNYEYSIDS